MSKVGATIIKDLRILVRDKVGLTMMFVMPILLAVIIASIQNSSFKLANENKVPLLLCSRDTGTAADMLTQAIDSIGMFKVTKVGGSISTASIKDKVHDKDALVAIIIPNGFSRKSLLKTRNATAKVLSGVAIQPQVRALKNDETDTISIIYHPVLQASFRGSIQGGLQSALQIVQSKLMLQRLYSTIYDKNIPDSLEHALLNSNVGIHELSISKDHSRKLPNATQHNIPAWTIFAMFFIVMSLGGNVVKEKTSGSFVRLKTLPTNYLVSIISKQLTYLIVTILQALVIFSIGVWIFPYIGLPKLNIPEDIFALFLVTLLSGWCAVSYAICVGLFAKTQEQANGFGAVSVVLLAAIGGILVPSFVMPGAFKTIMLFSPLHWCLECYYGLFLEDGSFKDILLNMVPLLGITLFLQMTILIGLKKKQLI